MKNFSIVLMVFGLSIRIILCRESQVYTFYPSLRELYDRGQPNGFAQNPTEDEINFQPSQRKEYVYVSDPPEYFASRPNQQTGDPSRARYPSGGVRQNVVKKVTHLRGIQDDIEQIEMSPKGESFIQDVNIKKHSNVMVSQHSPRPQNEIFAPTSNPKVNADNLVWIQYHSGNEGTKFQASYQQQQYLDFLSQRRGISAGVLGQQHNRPASHQLNYVDKSPNLPTKVDQYIQSRPYPQQSVQTPYIQNQDLLSNDRNRQRYPVAKTKTNTQQTYPLTSQKEYLHQHADHDPRFTHTQYQSPPTYEAGDTERFEDTQFRIFRTRPQNANAKVVSEFSELSSSHQTFNRYDSTYGSSGNQTYPMQGQIQSPPQTISDGKPSSDIAYRPQCKPGKLQGFTKLTAPHSEPIKPFYKNPLAADLCITKQPCEICCKRDEVEPCVSCCGATPLLSVRTLKTVLG